MIRSLLKDIFSAQAWQASILLCTIVVQLAVARFIGSAGSGVTAIIVSGASLCTLLIELNLQPALIRDISRGTSLDRKNLQAVTLGGRLLFAMFVGPMIAGWLCWTIWGHRLTVFAGIVGALLAQELNPSWWLQGTNQTTKSFSLLGAVAFFGCLLAVPLLFLTKQPGIESIVASLIGIIMYSRYWCRLSDPSVITSHIWAHAKNYARFARRNRSFLIGGVAVYLYLYPAQLLLASTRSVEESGLYRVALMPATAYYALIVAAFNAYYPKIVTLYADKQSNYRQVVQRITLLIAAMGTIGWLGLLGCKGLFLFAVGPGFAVSVALAPALVLSKAIGGIGLVLRTVLLAQCREKFVYSIFFLIGIFSVLTNTILIPHYGLLGAAFTEISFETLHVLILLVAAAHGEMKHKVQEVFV